MGVESKKILSTVELYKLLPLKECDKSIRILQLSTDQSKPLEGRLSHTYGAVKTNLIEFFVMHHRRNRRRLMLVLLLIAATPLRSCEEVKRPDGHYNRVLTFGSMQ